MPHKFLALNSSLCAQTDIDQTLFFRLFGFPKVNSHLARPSRASLGSPEPGQYMVLGSKKLLQWVQGRPIKLCIKVIWFNWKLFSGEKLTIIDMLRSRASRLSQAPMDPWQASLISHIWEILRYPWIQEVAYPGKPPRSSATDLILYTYTLLWPTRCHINF